MDIIPSPSKSMHRNQYSTLKTNVRAEHARAINVHLNDNVPSCMSFVFLWYEEPNKVFICQFSIGQISVSKNK